MKDEDIIHVSLANLTKYHKLPDSASIIEIDSHERWVIAYISEKGWVASNGNQRFPRRSHYATLDELETFFIYRRWSKGSGQHSEQAN